MDAAEFRRIVLEYHHANPRAHLPWRGTRDPYAVAVSELMLQQTQAERVVPKYSAFLTEFPTVAGLASARQADVLRAWQGLGYNRRAVNLKLMAERVMTLHGGVMPRTRADLRALPGIGPYTSGAIMAFAYDQPEPFIETNIRRAYLHHFFAGRQEVADREVMEAVEGTMDRGQPRVWFWALMDYGSFLGRTVPNPNRRSRHHAVQGPLKGSNREVRGALLKVLASGPALLSDMPGRTGLSAERIPKPLRQLETEGMITAEGGLYRLA